MRHTHINLHVSWFVISYSSCPVTHTNAFPQAMEDSPSGLWRTLGKRVGVTASRVRISYPPPGFEPRKPLESFGFRGFALIPPDRRFPPGALRLDTSGPRPSARVTYRNRRSVRMRVLSKFISRFQQPPVSLHLWYACTSPAVFYKNFRILWKSCFCCRNVGTVGIVGFRTDDARGWLRV